MAFGCWTNLRNDEWAQQVRLQIAGAVSDLHAADAQYHKDCMSLFRGSRNIQSSVSNDSKKTP